MKKFLLILFLLPFLSFNLHKIHVSLTNIVYKKESKTLQVTTRLFINDIEDAINNKYGLKLELDSEKETSKTDDYIKKYLKENVQIKLDDQVIQLHYLGKEYDEDIVFIYFEKENISNFKKIAVSNTCLFDLFDDQKNIIKIKDGFIEKTFFLKPNHFKEILTIK